MDNTFVSGSSLENLFDYPQYTIRGITQWDEIIHLGKNNIEQMISIICKTEKNLSNQICKLTDYESLLDGKSGEDFIEMSKRYENPKDIKVGMLPGNWSGDQEPVDSKSMDRQRGTTNFNICGWCDYASVGTGRYNYMITSKCSLLRDGGEHRFDSPCIFHLMDKKSISKVVNGIKDEINYLEEKRKFICAGVKILQTLKKDAVEKPYLVTLRPHNLFNVGDKVVVYVKNNKIVNDNWVKAMVIFGYRHHDGCVSFQADFPFHSGEYLEGRGGGLSTSRPECLLLSEFNYLRYAKTKDKKFFQLWVKNLDSTSEQEFITDLLAGDFATPPENWEPPIEEIPVNSKRDAENVLSCLDSDFFKTEKEIQDWATMQLEYIDPNKFSNNKSAKIYAERQSNAVIKAKEFLLKRLREKKN